MSRRALTAIGAKVLAHRLAGGSLAGWSGLAATPDPPPAFGPITPATDPDQGTLWVQPPNHGGPG